jgi:glyoxylase-like metal-dependent hydrolase (beta-lactamase superfamily II)
MLTVKAFSFNPVEENTYVLYNEKRGCCIIDPGFYFPEEREEFKRFIEENNLQPILLLNTHCHLDHVFGNKFVHDTWGLSLHIHEKEKQMLDFAPASGQMWQLPFENYEGELIFIKENSRIEIGNDTLEVRFTPGHSPGHVCFYDEADGFAISGDVLFSGSIGRTDLPGGDFHTLINSIQTQLFTLPDDTKIYCGHGPMTTIGFEKMNNPFVKLY